LISPRSGDPSFGLKGRVPSAQLGAQPGTGAAQGWVRGAPAIPALSGPFIHAVASALAPSFAYMIINDVRRDEFSARQRDDYLPCRRYA
jgi:hypothetical protein